jgi:hypothetical protein
MVTRVPSAPESGEIDMIVIPAGSFSSFEQLSRTIASDKMLAERVFIFIKYEVLCF